MALFPRSTQHLACSVCRTTGVAKIVENASPPFTDIPSREYTITGAFRVRAGHAGPAVLECSACGAVAG